LKESNAAQANAVPKYNLKDLKEKNQLFKKKNFNVLYKSQNEAHWGLKIGGAIVLMVMVFIIIQVFLSKKEVSRVVMSDERI